jgi:Uma2 family endonuclease
MATATKTPLKVFLQSDEYEPAADYVDGEVEERPLGELDHSSWQFAIQFWFGQHFADWNILICPELRIQTSATRFRIADVAILDRAAPMSQITTHPPLAVFEVLCPEDRVQRLTRKLGDYAAMGVREIWVIDPKACTFSRFEDGQLLRRDRFQLSERGIDFPVSEIAELVQPR